MRKQAPLGSLVVATIGLVIALGLRPISTREIVGAYVLALTALALVTLMRIARTGEEWERTTSQLELALEPHRATRSRPAELVTVERDLILGNSNAGHFHARLRPLFWSIATARSDNPREALDPATWELLHPDRPPPAELHAPGPSMARIGEIVSELEAL